MDYRSRFIQDLETALTGIFDPGQVAIISRTAVKTLQPYELSERCTALAPLDDFNEKTLRRYRACLLINGRSPKTIEQYVRTCVKLSDMLHKPFNEVDAQDLRYFLALEMDRGISAVTLENQRANLSAFFQWLATEELIPKNPMTKISPIRFHVELKEEFSPVEIDVLRSACRSKKERALIEFLLASGVRVSELTQMEIRDIDRSTLSVHVRHGKGDKERMTYISPVAMTHLAAYLDSRPENGAALFYNKNHKPLQDGGVRKILNTIAARVGLDNVHPHRFRRTFATGLARRGMEIQEVQKLLGHTGINTTMRYVNVSDGKVMASYQQYIA